MTNQIRPPHSRDGTNAPPPIPSGSDADRPFRIASITAGAALLLMSVAAIIGHVVAVDGLVTATDATRTAADIRASAGLFRIGIASLVLVIALDVVVACALYRVFRPVDKGLSMLAAAMRLVYSGVYMVAIAQLVGVIRLLGNDDYSAIFSAGQVNAQALLGITAYNDIWYVSQFLFGLHLLLIGYLAYRSGYVPRLLGVLLAISGAGYVIDSFGGMLSHGAWTDISMFTFIGEFLLALWLVIRGRRLTVSEPKLNVAIPVA